jgi:glycosyltransferase involved in cell wall biosynthesis
MKIGVDIRPLMTAPRTGVGEYTFELLNSIFQIDRVNQYFLFYNSGKDVSANIPNWQYENVKIINTRFPNKIFNASIKLFGWPKLDKIVANRCHCERSETKRSNPPTKKITSSQMDPRNDSLGIWFSPNLNFTAISKKAKLILTVHDLSFEFFPEFSTGKQFWWHKIVSPKKQCRRADLILTPSENTKRDIVNYYNIAPEKIKVIYPGIKNIAETIIGHPELVSGSYGAPQKMLKQVQHDIKNKYNLPDDYILFLGAIEPRKNIIGLIEAFEKSNTNATLIIAGAPGWKNKKIFERAKNSKNSERIKFLGFVPDEDKSALYAGAKIFVYPSFYEGFGFPILEAMQTGTPVIASNRSSLPEIGGSAVYLIDPNRPKQIAFAINELMNNQKLREWHIEKGRQQAQKFNWKNSAKEWLETIAKI